MSLEAQELWREAIAKHGAFKLELLKFADGTTYAQVRLLGGVP